MYTVACNKTYPYKQVYTYHSKYTQYNISIYTHTHIYTTCMVYTPTWMIIVALGLLVRLLDDGDRGGCSPYERQGGDA